MSGPEFASWQDFERWEREERETIANEIKYAPAYAALLGEQRIAVARAALTAAMGGEDGR